MASKEVEKQVKEIKDLLESLKSDFESCFDDHGEAWQNGEKGEQCVSNISACQEALDKLDEIE